MKEDNRPSKGMWAPGTYYNLCIFCSQAYSGDKRSTECADCAYKSEHSSKFRIQYDDKSMSFDTTIKIKTDEDLILVLLELVRVLETSNKAQYQ